MQIGLEMATLQEKTQKMDPKNVFSEKSPRIFSFWKKFLKTHIKRAILAETDISGHEIYLTGPSRAVWYILDFKSNIHVPPKIFIWILSNCKLKLIQFWICLRA